MTQTSDGRVKQIVCERIAVFPGRKAMALVAASCVAAALVGSFLGAYRTSFDAAATARSAIDHVLHRTPR